MQVKLDSPLMLSGDLQKDSPPQAQNNWGVLWVWGCISHPRDCSVVMPLQVNSCVCLCSEPVLVKISYEPLSGGELKKKPWNCLQNIGNIGVLWVLGTQQIFYWLEVFILCFVYVQIYPHLTIELVINKHKSQFLWSAERPALLSVSLQWPWGEVPLQSCV